LKIIDETTPIKPFASRKTSFATQIIYKMESLGTKWQMKAMSFSSPMMS
jgi:hypothetical protein